MRIAVFFGAVGLALAVPLAAPASAEVTGPCTGTIKDVNVASRSSAKRSDAIPVGKNEQITVGASTAAGRLDRYKIQLELAGIKWTVAKGSADGSSWTKSVNVAPYARYGSGYYKVSGVSTGGVNCSGAVLVKVGSGAFGSIGSIVGAALSVIGIGAVATNAISATKCGPRNPALKRAVIETRADTFEPDTYIADIKSPRDYVDCIEAICTYNPSRYAPTVERICGNAIRPRFDSFICRWG